VFDIVGKRRWFFLFSTLVTIPGLVFILLTPITGGAVGLQFSIDYTGGTQWVIRFDDESVTPDDVKAVFLERGLAGTTVATTAEGFIDIRTEPLDLQEAPTPLPSPSPGASPRPSSAAGPQGSPSPSPEASASSSPEASAAASAEPSPSSSPEASPAASPEPSPSPVAPGAGQIPTSGQLGEIAADLEESFGPFEQAVLTTIGPIVSADLIQQALLLIAIGSIGILLWITVRFHDVKFGVSALVALVHDVLVVLGIFAILGTFLRVQVDGLFVTAMLTVIGFSVHDTIVVFDRVRENRARHAGEPFDQIVNHSVLQTLGRSLMTSFTVILTLLSLLLFAGPSITNFVLALLIGIVSGTYSSIFVASTILVEWQDWEDRRHGRIPRARPVRTTTA
jgi:preprotein translocase SecF subunit